MGQLKLGPAENIAWKVVDRPIKFNTLRHYWSREKGNSERHYEAVASKGYVTLPGGRCYDITYHNTVIINNGALNYTWAYSRVS